MSVQFNFPMWKTKLIFCMNACGEESACFASIVQLLIFINKLTLKMCRNGCETNKDRFFYICGQLVTEKTKHNITDIVFESFAAYFGFSIPKEEKFLVLYVYPV